MIHEVNAIIAGSQILSSSVLTSSFDEEQQSQDIIRICLSQDSAFAPIFLKHAKSTFVVREFQFIHVLREINRSSLS
jgi:hypothetical protein